ncbi:Tetraspanin-10, partial [Cuculus canorus]
QASKLVELPYSSSDEDDGYLAGDADLLMAEQDPGTWSPVSNKPSAFSQCVRYLAFFWNLLFLLLGLLALAVGVWGLLAKGSLGGQRLAPLGSVLCLLRYQDEPDLRFLVDEVQRNLRCCGLGSYRDWESNAYFNCSAPGVQACSVPASCCLDPWQNGTVTNTQCAFGVLRLEDVAAGGIVHLGGCVAQLSAWLHGQAGGIVTGAAVLVLVEAAGVLMALKILRDI